MKQNKMVYRICLNKSFIKLIRSFCVGATFTLELSLESHKFYEKFPQEAIGQLTNHRNIPMLTIYLKTFG